MCAYLHYPLEAVGTHVHLNPESILGSLIQVNEPLFLKPASHWGGLDSPTDFADPRMHTEYPTQVFLVHTNHLWKFSKAAEFGMLFPVSEMLVYFIHVNRANVSNNAVLFQLIKLFKQLHRTIPFRIQTSTPFYIKIKTQVRRHSQWKFLL